MGTALVGFLGIIAGGVLTGIVQTTIAWLDRRRAGRIAARLLSMHLSWARNATDAVVEAGEWNALIDWDRFVAVWEQRNEALAAVMGTKDFVTTSAAFVGVENLALVKADEVPPSIASADAIRLATTYAPYIQVAIVVVHRASFTRWERLRGKAKPGEREAIGPPPRAVPQQPGVAGASDLAAGEADAPDN